MKIYRWTSYEHRFDEHGYYIGFYDMQGSKLSYGAPFSDWSTWDEEKHSFLLSLGFELIE